MPLVELQHALVGKAGADLPVRGIERDQPRIRCRQVDALGAGRCRPPRP